MKRGKLIIFSAPSGSGKSTILKIISKVETQYAMDNLEEIVEYQDLLSQFNDLQTQYNNYLHLQLNYQNLK